MIVWKINSMIDEDDKRIADKILYTYFIALSLNNR